MASDPPMRLSGKMTRTPRGRMLCDNGGMRWRLTGEALSQCDDAEEVTIEGVRRGLSVIEVYYVGRAGS